MVSILFKPSAAIILKYFLNELFSYNWKLISLWLTLSLTSRQVSQNYSRQSNPEQQDSLSLFWEISALFMSVFAELIIPEWRNLSAPCLDPDGPDAGAGQPRPHDGAGAGDPGAGAPPAL